MLIELQSTTEKHAEHCNCKILILNTETGRENNTAMVYSEKRAISSVETGKYESAWHSGISRHKWTGLCCTPCPLSTVVSAATSGQDSAVLPAHCPRYTDCCLEFACSIHALISPYSCIHQFIHVHDIIHSFISYP